MNGIKQKILTLSGNPAALASETEGYQKWIELYDTLTEEKRTEIERQIDALEMKPLISVVLPVYNTPEKWLRAAIDSVINQLYGHWELCIADDASTARHVKDVLKEYAAKDSRIRVEFRVENGHISAASNSALALAKGDLIALLDHDDELSPSALFHVVKEINRHPDADVIYSDEDKIDETGMRYAPHFKSDWNPDLFYSQNYLCHLVVYRRTLVTNAGGFRVGFEGSQDYDLAIRAIALTSQERIRHIPRVLYHWRSIAGSTAFATSEKDYATDAGIMALRDHFRSVDPKIVVEPGVFPTTYHVKYPIPDPAPKVTLIIPTRNAHELVKICVESIVAKTNYPNYEIMLVDNQSDDPDAISCFSRLHDEGKIKLLSYDAPFNYSAINNFAVARAEGEIIGLINNDVEVISPSWLSEMVSHAVRPEIGVVGAKLYYTDGRVQHGGVILGIGGVAGHGHKYFAHDDPGYFSRLGLPQDLSAVTAACILVRKTVYKEIGGLDEKNLRVAFNDVDFCLKVRNAGYRNLWTPYATLYHHESATRGHEDSPEKIARFQQEIGVMKERWGEVLPNDPFYNPNLTLESEDFSIAFPPRVQ